MRAHASPSSPSSKKQRPSVFFFFFFFFFFWKIKLSKKNVILFKFYFWLKNKNQKQQKQQQKIKIKIQKKRKSSITKQISKHVDSPLSFLRVKFSSASKSVCGCKRPRITRYIWPSSMRSGNGGATGISTRCGFNTHDRERSDGEAGNGLTRGGEAKGKIHN